MNITLLLFLTNSENAFTIIRNGISSSYLVPYCDSEIENTPSFNLLSKTLYFTVVVWKLYTLVAEMAF